MIVQQSTGARIHAELVRVFGNLGETVSLVVKMVHEHTSFIQDK